MSEDAADLSLVEVVEMLRARRLSATELVTDCLRRIAVMEPMVRAFVTLTPDAAIESAARADSARAAGRPVGLLAGVPVAVKDSFLTRGVRTTAGSRVLAHWVPEEDAAVWQRLTAQGAALIGKTTMHEFAYGTASHPTANPWDLTRSPGGSSGGSAAALAARMTPAAVGADNAGSLRIPAAACGVCTLRSGPGRISRYGAIPLSPTFDVAGPMARRMRDVSLLMQVLAGHDPRDRATRAKRVPTYPLAVPSSLKGRRIGVPLDMSWSGVDADIADVCRDVLSVLSDAGAELVEVATPRLAETVLRESGIFDVINQVEALRIHRLLEPHRSLYTQQVLERLLVGASLSRRDYRAARRLRRVWEKTWRRVMRAERLDALAHPTLDAPPPLLDPSTPPRGPGIRLSVPWSLARFAALSVPAGLDHRGLPVGLCLAGLPEREPGLLELGMVVDEVTMMWRRPAHLNLPNQD